MRQLIKVFIVIVILIGLGGIYLWFSHARENRPANDEREIQQVEIQPVAIRAHPVIRGELVKTVSAGGVTEAVNCAEIKTRISAPVIQLMIREGMTVDSGQVLLRLDNREFLSILKDAEGNLVKARIDYALLKRDRPATHGTGEVDSLLNARYETARAAYRNGEMDERAFRPIARDYEAARVLSGCNREEALAQNSGLAAAEARYERALLDVEGCCVRAPFNGTIGDCLIHVGDWLSPGQTLFTLVDLNKLRLKLQVLESDIGHIRLGEEVFAQFSAFPGEEFRARISGINPRIDRNNRICYVFADLFDRGGKLRDGMFGTVRVAVNRYPDRMRVPRPAVIVRDQRQLVFVVREGKAFWCYVETGLENDEWIEVISSAFDLKVGEEVIVDGHFALAHDAPVKIINEPATTRHD